MTRSESPGPATYDTVGKKSTMPSFSMGKRLELRRGSLSPGPTSYRVTDGRHSPQWRFGSSRRVEISAAKQIPGPGEYDVETLKGKGPSFSMKWRTKLPGESTKVEYPGPTTYGGLYTQFD